MKTEKRCARHNSGAGAVLPASSFYVVKNRLGKPTLGGYCKECCKEAATDYHRANPAQANAAIRKWRRKNPEKASFRYPSQKAWVQKSRDSDPAKWGLRYWKHDLKKKYLVTPDWYFAKLAEQGGHCALCNKTETLCGRRLNVDHDHNHEGEGEGVKVRGILCERCNSCIERLESIAGWADKATAYLAFYGVSLPK